MKELSLSAMGSVKGGNTIDEIKGGCDWTDYAGFGLATVGLFAAPFTGGVSLGLLAFGGFVLSAYQFGAAC